MVRDTDSGQVAKWFAAGRGVISPEMFGILQDPVSTPDHVVHLLLALGSIAIGGRVRNEMTREPVRT